jgi:hypothetical protein
MGLSWMVMVTTLLLELIAFGLALGAMTRRSKATIQSNIVDEYCSYSSDIATGLAAGAIIFLFFGQAIIMGVTGCFCCSSGSTKGKGRGCAIVAFLLAWFCFVVAELCLIVGAALNKVHTTLHIYLVDEGTFTCKEVRKSVFAAGAAFTFLTLLFGEIYYFSLVKATAVSGQQNYKTGASTINMTSYP